MSYPDIPTCKDLDLSHLRLSQLQKMLQENSKHKFSFKEIMANEFHVQLVRNEFESIRKEIERRLFLEEIEREVERE